MNYVKNKHDIRQRAFNAVIVWDLNTSKNVDVIFIL